MHRRLARRVAALAILGLFFASSARRAQAIGTPDDVRGAYHGVFQSTMKPGRWGLLEFTISDAGNRRWSGTVTMTISGGGSDGQRPFTVDGTTAASGQFMAAGESPLGMVQFHGQFQFVAGGAAIVDATYRFLPPGPQQTSPGAPPDHGTATMLRDFAGGAVRFNVNGVWEQATTSGDAGGMGTLHFNVTQGCANPVGDSVNAFNAFDTSFTGEGAVDEDSHHLLTFSLRGTINGDGRFLVIGWNLTNARFVVSGNWASARATYSVIFGDGITDHGTFAFTQTLAGPDSCTNTSGEPRERM